MTTTHSRAKAITVAVGAAIAALLTPALAPPATAYPEQPQINVCTITGTEGDDVLVGTDGPDFICGKGGNDTIWAGGGVDFLYGYAGEDRRLYGGDGHDRLDGCAGSDFCDGEEKSGCEGAPA